MDTYTLATKHWLEARFRNVDEQGIYVAHQPIYGFRQEPSDGSHVHKYAVTFQIIKSLSCLRFESFLDAGAAEGYKAYVTQKLFGVNVRAADLSLEACRRAREIFQIPADPADLHKLPYRDREFDVVLCSEALEHVTEPYDALAELLRVANKAVLLTLPNEPKDETESAKESNVPHAHIHQFDYKSFDYLEKTHGYTVKKQKMIHPLMGIPMRFVDSQKLHYQRGMRCPRFFVSIYNLLVPLHRRLFGRKAASFLIWLDEKMCTWHGASHYFLFLILKEPSCCHKTPLRTVRPNDIIDISVPLHQLPVY